MGAAPVEAPVWVSRPDGRDIALAYPKQAWRDQLVGRVELACFVTSGGMLAECTGVSEEPEGSGFAEAAALLSEKFHMGPTDGIDQSVAGRPFALKIRFVLPGFSETPAVEEFLVQREAGPFGDVRVNCRVTLEARFDNCQVQQAQTQELAAAALSFVDALNASATEPSTPRAAYSRVVIPITFRPVDRDKSR
jgi:hypothetical protein